MRARTSRISAYARLEIGQFRLNDRHKSRFIILSSDAIPWPLGKGLQHVKPIIGILWFMEEAFGAVGEGVSPVFRVVISCPMPDGDHGLELAVSLRIICGKQSRTYILWNEFS